VELVNFGVEANALNESWETPLLQASRAGHYQVCEFLMRKGASAELASVWGETPMHFLIFFDDEKLDSIADMMVRKKLIHTHGSRSILEPKMMGSLMAHRCTTPPLETIYRR
jgi:ankyrin repeat protein